MKDVERLLEEMARHLIASSERIARANIHLNRTQFMVIRSEAAIQRSRKALAAPVYSPSSSSFGAVAHQRASCHSLFVDNKATYR